MCTGKFNAAGYHLARISVDFVLPYSHVKLRYPDIRKTGLKRPLSKQNLNPAIKYKLTPSKRRDDVV